MVRVFILGQGMVATIFAVGLERIKQGEIKPYGVPLADVDIGINIKDIEIVASTDVDARKVNRTVYDIAKDFYEFDNVPQSLKKVNVFPGIELGLVRDIFPIHSLDEDKGIHESMDSFYNLLKRVKPDVVVDLTTTQYAEPCGSYIELERLIDGGGELTPSQLYAYLALRYMREEGPLAYVNLIPVPIANDHAFVSSAEKWGGVVFGDDGATGATPFS